jgi:hypothetical protein
MKVMRKMKKKEIKIVVLASFLMLVCIIAASPDSTLRFIDPTPANYTQEQDFTWGVLAINTHKSIYLPDETAFIGIAVLDNEGHMVCDADVTLTITDPSDNETVLSTGNGLIKVSPQCCVYGVTNLPDYYTNYEVDGAGTYVMNLTAVTADGTKSITDEFTVQNSVDFDVVRDGATRIYPSVPYVMNFTIKANKDYDGLIREYVPASFLITPQDGLTVTTVGDTKILTWNKNLVKGETYNIYYEFDAPDVSPYLFTLGTLEIGSFKEVRQWQIANDATVTYYFNDYSNSQKWVRNPGNMVDDSLGTYASCNKDDGDELLITNNCTGIELGNISKVEIRAYGYVASAGDNVSLQSIFTAGDGDDHQNAITATTANWTLYIEITTDTNAPSPWTWSDVQNLDCNVICHHAGSAYAYCAKVEIRVTYATWESYKEVGHTTVWGNDTHQYDSTNPVVYMYGEGFKTSHNYKVAYYDVDGWKVQTEVTGTSTGTGALSSQYDFTSNASSAPGTWHSVVLDTAGTAPDTYAAAIADVNYVINDSFKVQQSAIPEFPTVITGFAVCMLCAVAYMVMRRRAGRGDG